MWLSPINLASAHSCIYEPWYYRYIGVELAQEWKQSGLTLIEFLRNKNQAN